MELDSEVYVGIGGNIGDTYQSIKMALDEIRSTKKIWDLAISNIYSTTPVIPTETTNKDNSQNNYLNAVCRFKTSLNPFELLCFLQEIENKLGRERTYPNAPRTMDLDILFFEDFESNSPILTIPHPRWKERLFVIIPLLDLTETVKIRSFLKTQMINIRKLLIENENIYCEQIHLFSKT